MVDSNDQLLYFYLFHPSYLLVHYIHMPFFSIISDSLVFWTSMVGHHSLHYHFASDCYHVTLSNQTKQNDSQDGAFETFAKGGITIVLL